MSSSSLLKDRTVARCQHTNVFKSNSSLRVVDDKYSFTRARNILASLITSIDSLEPQSFWYNLSDNGAGNFCTLLRLEKYLCLSILKTCGLIRQKKVNEKMTVSVVMDQWINGFLLLFNTNCLKLKILSINLVLLLIIKSQGVT